MLKVNNDILRTVDDGFCAILVLLDLSAAFDTIDHCTLLKRLEDEVGLKGSVLKWFRSYLQDRTFNVQIGSCSSSSSPITCGIPQGSILGPLLFSLYMLPLGTIFHKYNIQYHCYADDTQFYIPATPDNTSSISNLLSCSEEIKTWMATNYLQLNENKTEVIIFGPTTSTTRLSQALGPLQTNLTSSIKNLGVFFDSALSFNKQISSVVKGSFYQLRTIAKLKPILTHTDLVTITHAFITSRLDYCNSLYLGLPQSSISRLQIVQNAAARLITGTRKRQHITPALIRLHWLPVRFRIVFKTLLFVFKALNGLAPSYLSDLIGYSPGTRVLRSATQKILQVPSTTLKTKGDRAFSVAAPTLWNELPFHIKICPTLDIFKSKLKTHLFTLAFNVI